MKVSRIVLSLGLLIVLQMKVSAQNEMESLDHQLLSERWETDKDKRKGCFLFTPYKPVYFLLGNYSNNPNYTPHSENPKYSVPDTSAIPLTPTEFKFQLSFKTKVLQGIFWGHGDLWAAYTQTSRWQLYNEELSRAFRETNYEPEFLLNFGTNYRVLGFKGNMVGVSMAHQSNGRNVPISRSWNRIIAHAGFEREHWEVLVRAWYRLKDLDDENPEITSYTGRGDIMVAHSWRHHQFSVVVKNNFELQNNRGSILLDWSIPISGHLKGYIQFFNGYGESMIDYNHKQTTIGLGVSLLNWM